jgi:CPA1 family monovalent cation:H+ antiporter
MSVGLGVHGLQTVFLLLFVLVAVFAVIAQRVQVPYPIVLVVAGLLVSFVPRVPRIPLDPDVVFLIFLPPLLYAAAWQTSWREFRRNLVAITMLAVGLVAFTVLGVALVSDHFITALDFKSGFVLGAVVATTDAIAATSIAARIGLPARIVEILEGESLLNDATGLLALEFGLQMLETDRTPTVAGGLLRLLWLVVGGVGVGLLIGAVMAWIERWVDDGPVEMVISMVVPYAAYLAAGEVHASGVLAVVACGLFLSRRSVSLFSPEVRIQILHGGESLNFVLNGLVFLLMGLQLPYVLAGIHDYSRGTLLTYGAVFSVVLIVLRLLWIFPAVRVADWVRRRVFGQYEPMPSAREVFVIGWTGMRGVVALAAALSLPKMFSYGKRFEQRNLIVFLTFAVILVTLVVQGLSLPPLIRFLGLARPESQEEEIEARRTVLQEVIAYLEEERARSEEDLAHGFDDLLHLYRHRLAPLMGGEEESQTEKKPPATYRKLHAIARAAVQAERRTAVRLRDEGQIGDGTLNRLLRELDLTETRQKAEH